MHPASFSGPCGSHESAGKDLVKSLQIGGGAGRATPLVGPCRRFLHPGIGNGDAAPHRSKLPPSCALCAQLPCLGIAATFCSPLEGFIVSEVNGLVWFGLILFLGARQ